MKRSPPDRPIPRETLPTYPGSGDTECLTLCKCTLERNDGVEPFKADPAGPEENEDDNGK